jgi:hypothetical protein
VAGHPGDASAFPHIVKPGESLAQIAERIYGRIEMEQLLVAANALDAGSGISIVAGMRLELPAAGHARVATGDSWTSLAETLLGHPDRSDVLALANDSMPWLVPADGQEIIVPYNLRYVVAQGDSTLTIAYRFLGERDKAWMLDRYNHLNGKALRRGDVVLVPLTHLSLTPEGRAAAASAGLMVRAEGGGHAREAQRRAEGELPQLASDIRGGRYVDAIVRGNRLLGSGDLAKPQLAAIQRALLEAYVALDATGLAETACMTWRTLDPSAQLDPVELSPKILRACTMNASPPKAEPSAQQASSANAPSLVRPAQSSGEPAKRGKPRPSRGNRPSGD